MPPCFSSHCDKWTPRCFSKNQEQLIYRYCDQSTITLRSHTKTSTLTHWVNRITRVTLCPRSFFFFLNKFTLLYSQYKNSFRGNFLYSFHRGLMVYRGNSVIFRTYEDERQRESIATFKNLDVDLVTFEPVSLLFFRVVTLHLFIIIENDSQFIFSNLKKKQLSLQFIGSAL